jgi:hypothetical protein
MGPGLNRERRMTEVKIIYKVFDWVVTPNISGITPWLDAAFL